MGLPASNKGYHTDGFNNIPNYLLHILYHRFWYKGTTINQINKILFSYLLGLGMKSSTINTKKTAITIEITDIFITFSFVIPEKCIIFAEILDDYC